MKSYEIYEDNLNKFLNHMELVCNNLRLFEMNQMAESIEFYIKKLTDNCWLIEKEK